MITTMRANGTKVSKPPPPVPPRPSKNVVAEALAKSRKSELLAPPPVVKSQSYSAIYKFHNGGPPKIDRGLQTAATEVEPPKPATRTLIYQSANVPLRNRVASVEEIRVNIDRKESVKRDGGRSLMKTSSFKAAPPPPVDVILLPVARTTKVEERDSSLESLGDSEELISRSNSFKTADANNSSDSVISEDEEGNWHNDTSDRNHVNTLIDEMFASVLELPDRPEPVTERTVASHTPSPPPPLAASSSPPSTPCDVVTIRTAAAGKDELSDDANDSLAYRHSCANQPNHDHDSKKTIVVIDSKSQTDSSTQVANNVVPIMPTTKTQTQIPNADSKHNVVNGLESNRKLRQIDDKFNHELLISELSSMKRERAGYSKRQRNPSEHSSNSNTSPSSECKIQHSDWVEVNDGKEIRLSSCQITIEDDEQSADNKHVHDIISRLAMANLHGLPPLPKSLSGFNIEGGPPQTPAISGSRPGTGSRKHAAATNGELGSLKKPNNLDAKLALLRREMYSLRQLDLSLLSQLWSLNESIQDFRHILQEQDERSVLSPPSPSPTTSSGEDVDGDDYFQPSPMRFRLAPPPPPPHRRTSNSSSGTGSSV